MLVKYVDLVEGETRCCKKYLWLSRLSCPTGLPGVVVCMRLTCKGAYVEYLVSSQWICLRKVK